MLHTAPWKPKIGGKIHFPVETGRGKSTKDVRGGSGSELLFCFPFSGFGQDPRYATELAAFILPKCCWVCLCTVLRCSLLAVHRGRVMIYLFFFFLYKITAIKQYYNTYWHQASLPNNPETKLPFCFALADKGLFRWPLDIFFYFTFFLE